MSVKSPAEQHWHTLARQTTTYHKDDRWRLVISSAKRKGDRNGLWERVHSTSWKPGGWATEAAALAARAQFKHWVDFERNAKKRAAQSESVASRSSAAMDALLQSPEPTRVSARKRPRDARVAVGLKAVGGRVQLGLAVAQIMPGGSPGPEELMQYRDGKPNSLADVERLIKVYKSHRSAEVFDNKFCHEE